MYARTGRPVAWFGDSGRRLLLPEGSRLGWTSVRLGANGVITIAGHVDGTGDDGMWGTTLRA